MADNMYLTAKSADVTVSRAQGRLMPGRVVQAAAAVTMAAVCGTVQPATAQTPPQAAAPAIPSRLAALRVGAQTKNAGSRIPVQAHTGSHGQGVSRPTISARSVRRTAHPLNGRRAR